MPGGFATHRVAVLGAGLMGVGIATLAVGYGLPVVLIEPDEAKLAGASTRIGYHMRSAQLLGALPEERTAGELVSSPSVAVVADCTVLVEAVTELPEVKTRALAAAAAAAPPGTPL